jgi:thiol-disulfide isomerase/thioredoxin
MSININCVQCGTAHRLNDKLAGMRVRCKSCDASIAVPFSDEPSRNLPPPPVPPPVTGEGSPAIAPGAAPAVTDSPAMVSVGSRSASAGSRRTPRRKPSGVPQAVWIVGAIAAIVVVAGLAIAVMNGDKRTVAKKDKADKEKKKATKPTDEELRTPENPRDDAVASPTVEGSLPLAATPSMPEPSAEPDPPPGKASLFDSDPELREHGFDLESRPVEDTTYTPPTDIPAGVGGNLEYEGWEQNFAAAKQQAAADNKHILLAFVGSDWCPPCKRLIAEVFATDRFKQWADEHYVLVMVDLPRGAAAKAKVENPARNSSLASQFGIRGIPAVILTDADGNAYGKSGYIPGGPEKFISHVDGQRAGH